MVKALNEKLCPQSLPNSENNIFAKCKLPEFEIKSTFLNLNLMQNQFKCHQRAYSKNFVGCFRKNNAAVQSFKNV